MKIAIDPIARTCEEETLYERLLPLDGARILELGCGAGMLTRRIAQAGQRRNLAAYEVDKAQHRKNLQSAAVANIEFKYGGAESIPEPDASFDIVLMFKSLHHVPVAAMPQALREIHRVLKPGGWLYVSEPIFAGAFNDVIKRFHDEQAVREAAFAALVQAVDDGLFALSDEVFFNAEVGFKDFAEFEAQVIGATHSNHQLDDDTYQAVKSDFERHLGPAGASFEAPMRVDVLNKRP